jgi:hypothetical protein
MDHGLIGKGELKKILLNINFLLINLENYYGNIFYQPLIGYTRIFKSVRFKLSLNCSTILDLYFMNKMVLNRFYIFFKR